MNLDEAIQKSDELLLDHYGELKTPFLKIGFVDKDSLSSRVVQGPLYDMVKLFDESKPLLKEHGLERKSKKGVVYIIKGLTTADARKISGLLNYHNINNSYHRKYVLSVPFDNNKINLFSRYSFQKFGGVTKEKLEEKIDKIELTRENLENKIKKLGFENEKELEEDYMKKIPNFDQFIAPYLKDKPLPRSTS